MDQPYTFGKIGHATHRRRPIALSWDKSAPDTALRKTEIGLLRRSAMGHAYLPVLRDQAGSARHQRRLSQGRAGEQ